MKVDFMIIGAMKCGTSTLAKILENHPQVSFCKRKEPHFFSQNEDWEKNIEEYHQLFEEKEGVIYGEGSTSYTQYPNGVLNIWDHLYDYNPNAKFIYIARDPKQRVVSNYMHYFARGYEKLNLKQAILKNQTYLNGSRYYMQIKPYIEKFGKKNVLVLDFDEFLKNKSEVLDRVADFLKLDAAPLKQFEDLKENVSIDNVRINHKVEGLKHIKPIGFVLNLLSDKTKQKLINFTKLIFGKKVSAKPDLTKGLEELIVRSLEADIVQFEQLTGKDYSKWKNY